MAANTVLAVAVVAGVRMMLMLMRDVGLALAGYPWDLKRRWCEKRIETERDLAVLRAAAVSAIERSQDSQDGPPSAPKLQSLRPVAVMGCWLYGFTEVDPRAERGEGSERAEPSPYQGEGGVSAG